jgi:hypothetical protein
MMYVYILRLEQRNYVFGLQNAFVPMTWWVTPVLRMQQATLTVNATRRFRYTLDLKKLEERTRFTSPAAHLRAGTHVIRVQSFSPYETLPFCLKNLHVFYFLFTEDSWFFVIFQLQPFFVSDWTLGSLVTCHCICIFVSTQILHLLLTDSSVESGRKFISQSQCFCKL